MPDTYRKPEPYVCGHTPSPDDYRTLAHHLNEALEDALRHIGSFEEAMRIREYVTCHLRERLSALDEAGPYGWVVEERVRPKWPWEEYEWFVDRESAFAALRRERGHSGGTEQRYRLRPLFAGTPEEVEDE